ncbi:bifunctional 3'-5' exonuclease/DNA polymerase [uncultured Cloacibacillus sp.]|uniref:bifunctional 3'-5' exonuclease/DNA polymerase n=1 Tax=uncultured Cloacibacillus sp. TaxID=889794 RepID=UPI0026327C30|nr:bifunctional 3'-5' exonuclease/DNA polymerase [uncultured Cloacibacillus sp.]
MLDVKNGAMNCNMMNYRCVTTVDEIRRYIGTHRVVAFDVETAPDDKYRNEDKAALDPAKAHIVGCSFSVRPGTGIYVPVDHLSGKNIDKAEFFAFLREFLSNKDIIKIAHKLSFESMMIYATLGIVIQGPVYDTICAAQMTLKNEYEFRELGDSGLKKLAGELFEEKLPTFTETAGGRHFDELDANDYETVRYGAADADFALRLYYKFNAWFDTYLPKHRAIVEKIESPAAVYIGIMEANGLPVNRQLIDAKNKEAEEARKRLRCEIERITGSVKIGNTCSTQGFKDFLFEKQGLPVNKWTDGGKPALNDEVLICLAEWCETNKPELSKLFSLVQEYRKWGKIQSTYIKGYEKHINSATGRIHPEMFSLSTETGRMSCRNPNAQNMPRKGNDPAGIRCFIQAPEGYRILSQDLSQIELRIGASLCRDSRMMQVYRNNEDIHAATTSVIFGISYKEAADKHSPYYKERRTIAKNVNFGIFYGISPGGLQRILKYKAGIDKTKEECTEIIGNLKRGYPKLSEWQYNTKAEAAKLRYTETWLGRRRYLPDITLPATTEDNRRKRSRAERCALNTPIQGTAADIIKLAMARILAGLPERMWLKPILQVHDELVFLVPEDKLGEAKDFIKQCMEEQPFPEFDLPLVAEASAGPNYGEMEELED